MDPTPPPSIDVEAFRQKLSRLQALEKRQQLTREKKLDRCRTDFAAFLEYVLKDESTGAQIILAELHKKWFEHIHFSWQRNLYPVILAPMGSGKTSLLSVGLPLFLFGQNSSLRIMLISANDSIARERLVLIRNYIDHSDEYHDVFPNVKADSELGWTKSNLTLQRPTKSKDPSLTAGGATSSSIGKRLDMLILDDINDAKNTLHQPKMRDVIWRNYKAVFLSRLEPNGRIVVVATRWHAADMVGKLLEDEDMRTKYAFLIQRVSEDFERLECETIVPYAIRPGQVNHHDETEKLFRLAEEGFI